VRVGGIISTVMRDGLKISNEIYYNVSAIIYDKVSSCIWDVSRAQIPFDLVGLLGTGEILPSPIEYDSAMFEILNQALNQARNTQSKGELK